MFIEFLNRESKPGNPPTFVKVDGSYAIKYDDVIYALDGSEISSYEQIENVTEIDFSGATFDEVTLLEAMRDDVSFLIAILSESKKKQGDVFIGSYFGAAARESDSYFEDCKILKMRTTGRSYEDCDVDFHNDRKSFEVQPLFLIAPSDLQKYTVVPGNAVLLHCGINPTWNSLVIYPRIEDNNGSSAKMRVRTYNAELYAFTPYSEEKDLITNSGDLLPKLLCEFTTEDLISGQKVSKEHAKHEAYLNTSKTVDVFVGLKLRPQKTYTCDALWDDNHNVVQDLSRADYLDALNVQGAERELISSLRDSNSFALVWRDRDDTTKYWIVSCRASRPYSISK